MRQAIVLKPDERYYRGIKVMKIAVIGANGHLGANLVRHILAAGHEAIAITPENSDQRSLQGLDIELRQADVLEPPSLLDH